MPQVNKKRIYLRPGQKPPPGYKPKRGLRGGVFYETDQEAQQSVRPMQGLWSDQDVGEIFDVVFANGDKEMVGVVSVSPYWLWLVRINPDNPEVADSDIVKVMPELIVRRRRRLPTL